MSWRKIAAELDLPVTTVFEESPGGAETPITGFENITYMSPTRPWQWSENDLLVFERQQTPERLDREYKAAGALANTDGKKTEIGKDVSAMANSAGGVIIYGSRRTRTRNRFEWLAAFPPTRSPQSG